MDVEVDYIHFKTIKLKAENNIICTDSLLIGSESALSVHPAPVQTGQRQNQE